MPKIQLLEDMWYAVLNEDGYTIATTNNKDEINQYLRDGFDVVKLDQTD